MRPLLAVPIFLAAIGAVVSGPISRPAVPAPAPAQNVQVIEVRAKKYEYSPSPIHVKQGTKVQLKITATDHTHGFKIGDYPEGSDKKGTPGLAFTSRQDCWKSKKAPPKQLNLSRKPPAPTPSSAASVAVGSTQE
jgi:hypothetical protein